MQSRQSRSEMLSIIKFVGRGIAIAVSALLLICFALDAHSEDLPDAPILPVQKHSLVLAAGPHRISEPYMTRTEMVDAGGVLFAHIFDWFTTERFLARGGKEAILPSGLVADSGGFFAFKLAVSGGQIAAEHYVDRMKFARRHVWFRYSAQAGQLLAIALVAKQDVDNWQYANHLTSKGGAR